MSLSEKDKKKKQQQWNGIKETNTDMIMTKKNNNKTTVAENDWSQSKWQGIIIKAGPQQTGNQRGADFSNYSNNLIL